MSKVSIEDLAAIIGSDAVKTGLNRSIEQLKEQGGNIIAAYAATSAATPHLTPEQVARLPPGQSCGCRNCLLESAERVFTRISELQKRLAGADKALVGGDEEPIKVNRAERRRKAKK